MIAWEKTISSVISIYKLIKDRPNSINAKADFFSNHIEPAFQSIEKIHKDYLETFTILLQSKNQKNIASENAASWLELRKIEYNNERRKLTKIDSEIYTNEFQKTILKSNVQIAKLTESFITHTIEYFYSSNCLFEKTAYSYVISVLKNAKDQNVENIFEIIEDLLFYLNTSYECVLKDYIKLKGICTK